MAHREPIAGVLYHHQPGGIKLNLIEHTFFTPGFLPG
jgi:hypothetical protein